MVLGTWLGTPAVGRLLEITTEHQGRSQEETDRMAAQWWQGSCWTRGCLCDPGQQGIELTGGAAGGCCRGGSGPGGGGKGADRRRGNQGMGRKRTINGSEFILESGHLHVTFWCLSLLGFGKGCGENSKLNTNNFSDILLPPIQLGCLLS